jgi:hypothetical protein
MLMPQETMTLEELEIEEKRELLSVQEEPLIESLQRIAKLARMDTGASEAAKSVLLYMWNVDNGLKYLYLFDNKNYAAAMNILRHRWIENTTLEELVPEISQWRAE